MKFQDPSINSFNATDGLTNIYKPSVLFMGHRQTVQNQIIRHRMWRLIKLSTVLLTDCSIKI